ncbi:MAG TPA: hypothetical protein VFG86_07605 [Chloroflexota bacterium]|nr:hypothetical protein [Chloroflexota bacterium]
MLYRSDTVTHRRSNLRPFPTLGNGLLGQSSAPSDIRYDEELLGGADGKVTGEHTWRQDLVLEHAQPTTDVHGATADRLADLARRPAMLAHQDLERGRLFFGRQVLALQVLDEHQDVRLVVGLVTHARGDLTPAELPGGLIATVTCDQLVAGSVAANHDWLQQPVGAQTCGEFIDGADTLPRIARVRLYDV